VVVEPEDVQEIRRTSDLEIGEAVRENRQRDQLKSSPALRPWRLKVDQVYLLSLAMDLILRVPLDKLRPSQVSDFYRSQLLRLSPGSVRRLHALLRRSLGVAVRWALIPWNPVTAVDPPSLTSVEVHPFDANEARLFLAAASCDRFHARWLIAVLLGLRQGEVLGAYLT
jgi:integrase